MAVAIYWQRSTLQERHKRDALRVDSTRIVLRAQLLDAFGILQSGDTLPSDLIANSQGDTIALGELARRGYRILYFYRPNCAACEFVTPGLLRYAAAHSRGVAFLQYRNDTTYKPEDKIDHWSFVNAPVNGRRPVLLVPSLLVADSNAVVRDAAHSDSRRVLRTLAALGVHEVNGGLAKIDSARREFQSVLAATTLTDTLKQK